MTLNHLERILLSDMIHMMSVADLTTINVVTPRIDSGYS